MTLTLAGLHAGPAIPVFAIGFAAGVASLFLGTWFVLCRISRALR